VDFAELMSRAQRDGWNLVALDLGIDLSTPAGEFMASVMASAAQWERRIIGQRTRDTLSLRRRPKASPLGRRREVPANVVARIVAERKAGASWRAIGSALDADGVATAHDGARWYAATVRAIAMSERN